jgi:uncharacterized repeat protein (TIGR03803 family)
MTVSPRALCLAAALLFVACIGDPPTPKDGESATVVAEPAGAHCAAGGVKIQVGSGTPSYVCNAVAGGAVSVTQEPAGAHCTAGGVRVEVDGSVTYVCNGVDGSAGVTVTSEAAGTNCATGGVRIAVGSVVTYVCTGATGQNGTNGTNGASTTVTPEPPGTNCPGGGVAVSVGSGPVSYVCNGAVGDAGPAGVNSLITMTAEPVGANCANGGTRVDSGLDANRDGVLQAGEITQTRYVCNGVGVPSCLVAGTLYGAGAADPANPCHLCVPATSASAFTPATSGTACTGTFPGTCQHDVCVATLSTVGAFDIAVDGAGAYWTQPGADGGVVMKMALQRGATPVTLASDQDRVSNIAVAAGTVYWTNNSSNNLGVVNSCAALGCGGAPTTILSGIDYPASFAVSESRVFVGGAFPASLTSGPLAGGTGTTLYSGPGSGALPEKVLVTGGSVYFAVDSSIISYPVGGGAKTVLATGLNNPGALAASGGMLFFTELAGGAQGLGTLKQVPLAGGTVTTLTSGLNNPMSLVTDGVSLYWTNSGQIMKLPIGGGTPSVYADNQGYPRGLALMGNSVLWSGSGVTMATPK